VWLQWLGSGMWEQLLEVFKITINKLIVKVYGRHVLVILSNISVSWEKEWARSWSWFCNWSSVLRCPSMAWVSIVIRESISVSDGPLVLRVVWCWCSCGVKTLVYSAITESNLSHPKDPNFLCKQIDVVLGESKLGAVWWGEV